MEKDEISETKIGAVNHGMAKSNEELSVDDMALKSDNIRARKPKQPKSPPNDNLNKECSSLWSIDSDNTKELKKQWGKEKKTEEIVLNVSNLC